jgi:hypothetical protein
LNLKLNRIKACTNRSAERRRGNIERVDVTMSDAPKPGSLRDRIAAFEKPSTSNEPARALPPLRPKPADGVPWKPKPPTGPSADTPAFAGGAAASNEGEVDAVKSSVGGEMSVSDVGRVLDAGDSAR